MNENSLQGASEIFDIINLTKITFLIFGIVVLGIVVKSITSLSKNINKHAPSKRLLIAQVTAVLSFVIYIIGGGYLFYGIIQPPKALLIGISGTLAVALGLSLKDLVASIVAGVILLFDRPFQVGDRITFDNTYGEITNIGLRAVRLVTLDDSVVTIPNSRFITDVVSSGNFGNLDMMIEIDFHLPLGSKKLRDAKNILYETAATSKYTYLKKPISIVLSEVKFNNKAQIQLRVKCYVIDVRFEKALQTDIILRGSEALNKYEIER